MTAGWDARYDVDGKVAISVFDLSSGGLVARVGAFENVVLHLAFSRDGRWLALTLGGRWGLRVIDATTWREIVADRYYVGDCNGAEFDPDGGILLENYTTRR